MMSLWVFFSQGNLRKLSKIFLSKYLFSLKLFVTCFGKNASIVRRVRQKTCCCSSLHLLHLPSLEFGWIWMKGMYRCFCIYLTFSVPSVHRGRITSGSLWAQDLFGAFTLCFPRLAETPQHPQKEHYLPVQGSCPFLRPSPCEELCCAWWKAQGNEQLTETPNPHIPCLISFPSEHNNLLTAAWWWKPSTLLANNCGWAKLVLERDKKELAEPPAFCWYPPASQSAGDSCLDLQWQTCCPALLWQMLPKPLGPIFFAKSRQNT